MEPDTPLPLTPDAPPASAPPAEPAPPLSVAEHEAANPVTTKHRRARSHAATPEDVPRIAALTKKLREAEAKLAAQSSPSATATGTPRTAPVPVAGTPPPVPESRTAQPAPSLPPMPSEPSYVIPVVAAAEDPEPDPADYVDNPSKNYVKDQARWEARQEIRDANERAMKAAELREAEAARHHAVQYWNTRATAAKTKYPDFEAVAYGPSPIPKDSMVDRFILESAAGLDVLYHLHKNRSELDAMLALPLFDPETNRYPQVEALTLLAQRLSPNGRSSAVTTGSAPPPTPVARQPRPPNPVRTGPMSSSEEPPGAQASVAQHEAFYYRRKSR